MARTKNTSKHLSIFLLKEDVWTGADALVATSGLNRVTVPCGPGIVGELFYVQSGRTAPRWTKLFDGTPAETPLKDIYNAHNAAVFFIEVAERLFALTFGTGRTLLTPGTWEEDFGLKATLNTLSADQVRSVDHTSFDAMTTHTRAQSSRPGTCVDFGVDIDQNLIRALTGIPSDSTLATRMTGMDALAVNVPANVTELPDLLARYLDQYQSSAYKTHFAWVDHLRQVRDQARVDALDAELVRKLAAGERDRLWLAVPDILDWDDVEDFAYRPGKKAPRYRDTLLPDLLKTIDPANLELKVLKARQVYAYRPGTTSPSKNWTVYRCLYAEIDQGGDTFLLYDGRWYRIARDFVTETNEKVARYVVPSTLPAFEYGVHADENAYNEDVASLDPAFTVMDCNNVLHGGGHSAIEFCDLMSRDRRLVHVKRYKGSAALSHLFSQGEVSARLLAHDRAFRQKVIAKLEVPWNVLVAEDGIAPAAFTVVFAITSESKKDIASSLPFFSRLTFVRTATILSTYGYRVELMKIEVTGAQMPTLASAPSTAVLGAASPTP